MRSARDVSTPTCPCPFEHHLCEAISANYRLLFMIWAEDLYFRGFRFVAGVWPPPHTLFWCQRCRLLFSEAEFLGNVYAPWQFGVFVELPRFCLDWNAMLAHLNAHGTGFMQDGVWGAAAAQFTFYVEEDFDADSERSTACSSPVPRSPSI